MKWKKAAEIFQLKRDTARRIINSKDIISSGE